MSNSIHPTAILDGDIRLGNGNVIGPYVVMQGDMAIGNNNVFGPGVSIENRVTIGNDNHFYAHAAIGAVGEMGAKGDRLAEEGGVFIGNSVTCREHVCVHFPVYTRETRIHDNAYLMNKSYVAHDAVIGQGSVLSAGVLLGGRVILEEGVTIGMGASVHQRCQIGAYAMIGMQTPVTRDILPFAKVAGNPARIIGFNRRGTERLDIEAVWMEEMESFFGSALDVHHASRNPLILQVLEFFRQHPDALLELKR